MKQVPGALMLGMAVTVALGIPLGVTALPQPLTAAPELSPNRWRGPYGPTVLSLESSRRHCSTALYRADSPRLHTAILHAK